MRWRVTRLLFPIEAYALVPERLKNETERIPSPAMKLSFSVLLLFLLLLTLEACDSGSPNAVPDPGGGTPPIDTPVDTPSVVLNAQIQDVTMYLPESGAYPQYFIDLSHHFISDGGELVFDYVVVGSSVGVSLDSEQMVLQALAQGESEIHVSAMVTGDSVAAQKADTFFVDVRTHCPSAPDGTVDYFPLPEGLEGIYAYDYRENIKGYLTHIWGTYTVTVEASSCFQGERHITASAFLEGLKAEGDIPVVDTVAYTRTDGLEVQEDSLVVFLPWTAGDPFPRYYATEADTVAASGGSCNPRCWGLDLVRESGLVEARVFFYNGQGGGEGSYRMTRLAD